jgi:hypothetical protein
VLPTLANVKTRLLVVASSLPLRRGGSRDSGPVSFLDHDKITFLCLVLMLVDADIVCSLQRW